MMTFCEDGLYSWNCSVFSIIYLASSECNLLAMSRECGEVKEGKATAEVRLVPAGK